ncbi:MAG: TetR/AcrR family transcriptional regulator [Clostridiales bacterium]|nr:TetR/AcrR family transcriptional regulator [Clostridiales bacterium]
MQKKPDRRIKKTKVSLYNAFYDLLKKKDYSEITVKELAEEADITRKTFYLHYNTLDDLLWEFLTERYSQIRESMNDIDLFSEDFNYMEFFTHLRELFENHQDLLKKIMGGQNSRYVMQRVMEENEIKAFECVKNRFDMKPEILLIYFRYYTRGITGTFMEWFADPGTLSMEEFVYTIKSINLQMRQALLPYRKKQQP